MKNSETFTAYEKLQRRRVLVKIEKEFTSRPFYRHKEKSHVAKAHAWDSCGTDCKVKSQHGKVYGIKHSRRCLNEPAEYMPVARSRSIRGWGGYSD